MKCRIEPIDGWGYHETVDGNLAPGFDAEMTEAGVRISEVSKGWKGKALNGKYAGCYLELTPRHVEWSGVVVLHVYPNEQNRNYHFSGMADTEGLECSWK